MRMATSSFGCLVLIFASFMMISCSNPSGEAQKKDPSDTTPAVVAGPVAGKTVDSRLDVLYMDTAQFNKLVPKTGNPKKWVLKHGITDDRLNAFTLSVWPEKSQRFEVPPLYLRNWIDSKTDLGDTAVLFGDQSLMIKQIKRIRQKLSDSTVLGFIIFVPRQSKNVEGTAAYSTISYDIFLTATLDEFERDYKAAPLFPRVAFEFTNPSPPATSADDTP